jgi:AraC-like DNA-binding protein
VRRDPLREWREEYARRWLGIDFAPLSDAPFRVSVQPIFEDLRSVRTVLSPGTTFRDAELIKDGDDSFSLLIAQSKNICITHQGRYLQLDRGDATLLHVCATGSVGSGEEFAYMHVLIPYADLAPRIAGFGEAISRRVPRRSEALRLLRAYIRAIEKGCFRSGGHEIVRRHIIDLAALAITRHGAFGETNLTAVATARLHAALDHVASHISDPDLSLSKVAQSLRISPRYLQRLLETSGTSFTAHVTELRLQRAFALLRAQGAGRVADIAMQAGFSDISHFNRLFRSRFGATPSDVRAQGNATSMQEAKT